MDVVEAVTKNLGGRPTKYSKKLAKVICGLIADGLSVHQICKSKDLPSRSTFNEWLKTKEDLRDQYVAAKMLCADLYAEETIEIADDSSRDYVEDKDGKMVFNHENVQRSRLRVDARKWVASKLAPKKYGDKITNEVTGKDGGPIEGKWTVRVVKPKVDVEDDQKV